MLTARFPCGVSHFDETDRMYSTDVSHWVIDPGTQHGKSAPGGVTAVQMCEMTPRDHQDRPGATVCMRYEGIAPGAFPSCFTVYKMYGGTKSSCYYISSMNTPRG